MADKNREDWIKSFYFGEAPKQQNTGGLTLADELDRLYEERQKRNKNNHRLVTRSGHDTFMEDEYGRQFFTYEGWKENQEASVAYMKLAGEALKHLGSGFFEGQGYKRLPQNMTEAGLRALDGIIDLGKGAGRFTAKAWRDDEEENKAAYNAYLSLTGKFLELQGVYKDEEGNIVPPSTPGAKKVQGPKSYLGNYARGLGDLFNDPVKGEALGESFDEDVNMKWADSWSILLDPTWLIPGGQAAKVSNLVDKGVKGEKLARLTKSLKDIAEKVPKSEKLSSAGEWAAQFARRPATRTADLAGKAVSKTGEGVARAADTKVGKYAVAGTMGYGIYKAIEDDESLIDTLIAGIGTYATAKGAPQYIGKVGAKAKTIGNTISGAARGAQMGSLGIAAKQGGYSQGAIEALKRIDNPAMNRTLRLAGEISDAAVKGSVFGAGMGYLIAGREGAAGGLGVGVLGGPIGMAQGYALGKITGAGKITYATKENGEIVTKEVDSILDIPDQDLVSNFLAQLPSSDRDALSVLTPDKLLGLAKLDAFGRGMLIGGDTGDLNIRYMFEDQIAADPQLRGTLDSAESGYEGLSIDDYDGKPLVVVNVNRAVDPLRTLAHELFHPKFESGDPNDPLMAIRAQLESNLFGIKDQEGNEVVAGQYNDAQFKMLESDYVSMMSEGWQNEYYQRPIQARRSFVAGEILSEAFGNFAEASKGDVVAYANKVNKRAKGTSPEAGLLTNQLYKFQSALLARMQNAFKAMGVEFDAGGNPVSKLFKDPSTARAIKLTGDGRLIGKGGEGLANSPEINALLSEYVLAKDKLLKRLSLADETEGSDGFAVSAKELLSKNDPGTVEKFRNSGMFKLDEQGNVQYENGMPVLLTRKQRKERETTVSMALFQALDSVAAGEYVTGLQRKVHSDGEVSYRGRYMSEEQLAAIMQLPDEVVPQSMKAKIQKLNENLAKGFDAVGNLEGDPAMNFLISYYKATTGSAYTSRASMKHQHVSPYGFSISKAGNFNLETFSISRFENKLNNWWKRAQKGNSKYKKFFDLFGGSPDNFRSAAVQYMHNQVRGVRNEATPQKDAIYDFMNAGEQGMMEQNPDRISTNKEHVVPISLRVDRMEEVNTIMGDTFPVNYGKLKRNFMPAGADKGGAKKVEGVDRPHSPTARKMLQEFRQGKKLDREKLEKAIEEEYPIREVPIPKMKDLPTEAEMFNALNARQRENIGRLDEIPAGTPMTLRQDVDSMSKYGVGIVTGKSKDVTTYENLIRITDPELVPTEGMQRASLKIGSGEQKKPTIVIKGKKHKSQILPRWINTEASTQAGFNPDRHSYIYDRSAPHRPIIGGDEVVQIGNTVFVKNAKFGDKGDFLYMPAGKSAGKDAYSNLIYSNEKLPKGVTRDEQANLLYKGKQPQEWSPEEFKEFGEKFDVKNLGPLSEIETIKDGEGGGTLRIPGGLHGKFTFYDLLWIKNNNPEAFPRNDQGGLISEKLHAQITDKLARTMTPEKADNLETFNRMVFGMLSPNAPLLPNEFGYARLKFANLDQVKEIAKISELLPKDPSPKQRKAVSDKVKKVLGIGAKNKGGLGIGITQDFTNVADFARLWLKDPEWFNKAEGESWGQYVDRVGTQLRGLGTKTASFGGVWQDPAKAMISAIDRHMAKMFAEKVIEQPEMRARFENGIVSSFNKNLEKAKSLKKTYDREIKTGVRVGYEKGKKTLKRLWPKGDEDARLEKIAELTEKFEETVGSKGLPDPSLRKAKTLDAVMKMTSDIDPAIVGEWMGQAALDAMGAKQVLYRNKKGEVNPNVRDELRLVEFISEPEKFKVMSDAYREALNVNEEKAKEMGVAVFPAQWTLWDRIRGRVEPHEVMFPGYHKLPKMGPDQIRDVMARQTEMGYATAPNPVKSGDSNPSSLAYFMPAGKGGDIFYSNSSKALESPKVRNSATGAAMLNDIIRQDPAARQEMKWIDLDRWLMDKKGKVTKEEVQDFIDANQIAVVEKVRGGEESPELRAAEEAVDDAKRNMWDADDRGTYQEARDAEMAFEEAVANLEFVSKDFDPQFDKSDLSLPGAVKGSYRELELMLPKRKGEQFTDSHFETDENVFAHVRFNERIDADGKRMLFIEEVQSDWAAKGRDVGFNKPYINGDIVGGREESVPAAPFVSKRKGNRFVEDDKWRALAMKRMIRWASDNNFDRVGWITGRDTADRYNLSKFIDRVEYQRLPGEDRTMVSAWDKAGNKIIPDRMVASKDMKRTVGRDLAEQIAADKSGSGEFEGLELAVGGEGHKQFYDIDLPNYTGKYVKKWGGKVGMVDVSLRAAEDVEALKGIPERTTKAHYVDITPQMKADVQQGQAMFMPAGDVLPALNVRNELSNKFADDIVAGRKTIETRRSRSMDPLIGERVKIIRTTGKGSEAMVIGEATVGEPVFYRTKAQFEEDFEKHLVPSDSGFGFSDGGKYGYPMIDAEKYDKPYKAPKNKGIVFTKNVGGPSADKQLRLERDLKKLKRN